MFERQDKVLILDQLKFDIKEREEKKKLKQKIKAQGKTLQEEDKDDLAQGSGLKGDYARRLAYEKRRTFRQFQKD